MPENEINQSEQVTKIEEQTVENKSNEKTVKEEEHKKPRKKP